MTISEFKDKIAEVERFYSKDYVNEQKNELYKYFKEYTIKQFAYVISNVYQKCKFLPSIAEIIDIEKEIPFTKVKKQERTNCSNCGGTGYVLYHKEINGTDYEFVAYCNCSDEYKFDGRNMKDPRNKSRYRVMSEVEAKQRSFIRR